MSENRLREFRRRLGLTQRQLADALGADQASVSRWERGIDTPRPDRLARMRDLLLRDEERRAADRQIAMVRANLLPAVVLTADFRLGEISGQGIAHFARTRGIDVSEDVGRNAAAHFARVDNPAFGALFTDDVIVPEDTLLARVFVNIRGEGSVCFVEPIFREGEIEGSLVYQGARYAAPPSAQIAVERVEIVRPDAPLATEAVLPG